MRKGKLLKMKKIQIKNKIKENKYNLIIFMIYAIVTFIITVVFHEKWRDEAQAWLIARDIDIIGIIKQMAYEGHPPLWHFILMPFAKMGFPYMTISIISWGIMCLSGWLLLSKSPFKKVTQVLILLSYPFLYLYPVIARSYCLIPLAVELIAIYYPQRREKKIKYALSILLLAYTHVLMLGLVGILYLIFFLEQIFYTKKTKEEKKKLIISIIITFIGIGCLFLMLVSSITTNTELQEQVGISNIIKYKIKILFTQINIELFGNIAYSFGFKVFYITAIIGLIIIEGRKNIQNVIIGLVSIVWQIFIYLFIYATSTQKANLILLIGIFIAWITLQERKEKEDIIQKPIMQSLQNAIVTVSLMILILNCMNSISKIKEEIQKDYSGSKSIAKYIEENIEDNSIFICMHGPFSSAIIPYTENKKFWNPSSEEYFTYMIWDTKYNEELEVNEVIERVRKNFTSQDKIYLLDCNITSIDRDKNLIQKLQEENTLSEVLYKSKDRSIIYEEVYELYKINL